MLLSMTVRTRSVAAQLAKSRRNAYVIDARHAGRWPRSPTELAPISPSWDQQSCSFPARAWELGAHYTGDH